MEKVSVFLSITGLVWCALFALIMIGVVFLIKRNSEREYDTNNKLFLILYIITMILIIMAIPAAVIVGVLVALKERMKQIEGGEEDEARKY